MPKHYNAQCHLKTSPNLLIFSLLSLLLFLIYSNSITSSWHLDDHPNILDNEAVHLKDLNYSSLANILSDPLDRSVSINRQVAYLTFGFNWLIGADNPTGYHLVNIFIHILTSYFLYRVTLFLLYLLSSQRGIYQGQEKFIALLATTLWAVAPIHTQAVTYIVQRMTSLSALFSIISIHLYILARINKHSRTRFGLIFCCILFFLLALFTKENSILLPGSIVFIELLFFKGKDSILHIRSHLTKIIVSCSILCVFLIVLLYLTGFNFTESLSGYSARDFTFKERILTEPRILFLYLSQIFFPLVSRLSLEHDIVLSTSLFHPWTTGLSIFAIASILIFSALKRNQYPLLSFSIIFFFYNHIIESTIFPLELIFEHRNYLPSFFLFLPFAAAVSQYTNNSTEKRIASSVIYPLIIGFIINCGVNTYIRNESWITTESLCLDSIEKAPNSSRPYYNLASHYLEQGKIDLAISLYQISLTKNYTRKGDPLAQTLLQLAYIYLNHKADYKTAIEYYRKLMKLLPDALTPRKNLAISLIMTGQLNEALHHADILLKQRPVGRLLLKNEQITRLSLLNLKSLILLKLDKPDKALPICQDAFKEDSNDLSTLKYLASALTLSGEYERAKIFLSHATKLQTEPDIYLFLQILSNSFLSKNNAETILWSRRIITDFSPQEMQNAFKILSVNNTMQPINTSIIAPVLAEQALSLYRSTHFLQ